SYSLRVTVPPAAGISCDETFREFRPRSECCRRYARLRHCGQVSTSMKKLRFLVSLTTNDDDYQIEQAQSAEEAARKFGVELQVIYADNDAITQSTQLLK